MHSGRRAFRSITVALCLSLSLSLSLFLSLLGCAGLFTTEAAPTTLPAPGFLHFILPILQRVASRWRLLMTLHTVQPLHKH